MNVKFYCKELGFFSLSSVPVYRKYKEVYPDMVHINEEHMLYIFDECIELLLSK